MDDELELNPEPADEPRLDPKDVERAFELGCSLGKTIPRGDFRWD
jgi:hypothetical protein